MAHHFSTGVAPVLHSGQTGEPPGREPRIPQLAPLIGETPIAPPDTGSTALTTDDDITLAPEGMLPQEDDTTVDVAHFQNRMAIHAELPLPLTNNLRMRLLPLDTRMLVFYSVDAFTLQMAIWYPRTGFQHHPCAITLTDLRGWRGANMAYHGHLNGRSIVSLFAFIEQHSPIQLIFAIDGTGRMDFAARFMALSNRMGLVLSSTHLIDPNTGLLEDFLRAFVEVFDGEPDPESNHVKVRYLKLALDGGTPIDDDTAVLEFGYDLPLKRRNRKNFFVKFITQEMILSIETAKHNTGGAWSNVGLAVINPPNHYDFPRVDSEWPLGDPVWLGGTLIACGVALAPIRALGVVLNIVKITPTGFSLYHLPVRTSVFATGTVRLVGSHVMHIAGCVYDESRVGMAGWVVSTAQIAASIAEHAPLVYDPTHPILPLFDRNFVQRYNGMDAVPFQILDMVEVPE